MTDAQMPERIWAWEIDNDGWWDTDRPAWIEAPVEYLRADLCRASGQVRALEWSDEGGNRISLSAKTPFEFEYIISSDLVLYGCQDGNQGSFPTTEAAKAAAQADYERRILAALAPQPAEDAEPVAIPSELRHVPTITSDRTSVAHPSQPSASVAAAIRHLHDIINCGNCPGSRHSARLALRALKGGDA